MKERGLPPTRPNIQCQYSYSAFSIFQKMRNLETFHEDSRNFFVKSAAYYPKNIFSKCERFPGPAGASAKN